VKGVKPPRPSLRCQVHLQPALAPLSPMAAKEPSSPYTAPSPQVRLGIVPRK